ncbi:MAG: GNAT family N-acetyltransferase [Armatimonadota bacterium]|nr:GNAT family N-acetyltransferase [Armatimonadota bacterium]MCX7776735.1 GNAT family N-acetyltransferase [Armatimonadota bacterium]MDW8025804.1 GNAT family N-acetyltransferase [Armatimonadota bacterium]
MSQALEEDLDEKLKEGIQLSLRNGLVVMVRKLRRTDGESFYKFMCNLSPYSRSMFHPHPFDKQAAERAAADADSPNSCRLVATYSDEIIAYACWTHHIFRSHFPIVSIAVADAFQNQGLGRQLMKILIEIAKRRAKRGLELDVYKENTRAIHLYESLGFKRIGETLDKRQYVMRLEFEAQADQKNGRGFKFMLSFWRRR